MFYYLTVDDVERTVTIQLDGDEFTMEFLDAPEEEVGTFSLTPRCVCVWWGWGCRDWLTLTILNQFTLSGFFYRNSLDRSVSISRVSVSFYCYHILQKFLYLMQTV